MIGFRPSGEQKQVWIQSKGRLAVTRCVVRLQGDLNAHKLRQSCEAAAQRHEILRTTFACPSGMQIPYQLVNDALPLCWEELGYDGFDGHACVRARETLDLQHGPVVHCAIASRDPDTHYFAVSVPTLCSDAAGLRNLVAEVLARYHGNLDQAAAPLQYADFAERQHSAISTDDPSFAEGREYWQRWDFSLPAPSLPFERKLAHGGSLDAVELAVDCELAARVTKAAAACGTTESAFLLACWSGLLWRLSGAADIPVVLIGDGRHFGQAKSAVGLFARPLPVLSHIEADMRFGELLRQVHASCSEVIRWQDQLRVEDVFGPDDRPLPLAFDFRGPLPAPGLSASFEDLAEELYRFRIKLACAWPERDARARFEFDSAAVDIAEIRRIGGYYLRLLERAAADTDAALADLDFLPDAERREIVEGFNQTRADFPLDLCFHEMFEQQVERTPDRPALVFDPIRLTYCELNADANRLAHYLRSRAVTTNVRVGLFVRRSADMIVGLLGILKAGGAYVALHPDLPPARLAHQLAETGAAIIVTQATIRARLPEFAGEIICLDSDWERIRLESAANLEKSAGPGDGIYVIYTSGSTGVPKGVALRHENVVNYTQSICRQLGANESVNPGGLHFANVSTLAADLGNTPIYAALASGGCLHIIADDVAMDAALYGERCDQQPIDVLKITPSHLVALLDSGDPRKILPRKHLVVGGEALRWELVRRIQKIADCAILNHYAPTECTIGALTFHTEADCLEASLSRVAPLGHPIDNMTVYILDARLKPVPAGVGGELFIGGAGVSNGYVNRPDLTAERFLADPLDPSSGKRFYRSGDRARFLPGGSVEFLGREDDQVKIRGFRVELGEIEAVLGRHPEVERAVVCLKENESGDRSLVAFLIAPQKPTREAIREFLHMRLPDYMIPSQFVFVDVYPLNANGKVDRRALATSMTIAGAAVRQDLDSADPVERQVAAIWQEVLGVNEIHAEDNFFDLGGHSLLATQVISRLRNALGVQVPLRAIFEAPTVAGLAGIVSAQLAEAGEAEELARALAEVESLSDEEVHRLLQDQAEPQ